MRKNSVYLGIIMLIFGIISGCVTEEKVTNVETLGQLIGPGDLPEMTLMSQNYMSVPNGSEFNISAYQSQSIDVTTYYEANSTPNGSRNIGENFLWQNKSGKQIQVGYMRYDTAEGLNEFFEKQERACLSMASNASEVSAPLNKVCYVSEIGDHGIYLSQVSVKPDITKTLMQFSRNNYFIAIVVDDENYKSVNETLSIAGIIDSRLPKNKLLNIDI